MPVNDITDLQVLMAFRKARDLDFEKFPYDILSYETGEPVMTCWRAMKRAYKKKLVDCELSLRTGWLTAKGRDKLKSAE